MDTNLSFLANLVLAFPVILLFYLLVTPEIRDEGIPILMAAVLFLFPVIFLLMLFQSRYYTQPMTRNLYCGITIIMGLWAYSGLAFNADPLECILYGPEPFERVCIGGICELANCIQDCARHHFGYQNT